MSPPRRSASVAPARRAAPISSRSASLEPSIRRWVMTATLIPATSASAAPTSASAPARPPSASHTNVSRLPLALRARRGRSRGRRRRARPRTRRRRRALPPRLGLAHHPAAADARAADLELRLDHRERVVARRGAREHGGQHLAQGDEGDVEHDQLRARRAAPSGSSARALVRSITVTRSSSRRRPVELAVGDVEGDDVRRARLQQAVREAAGRRADVEAAAPRRVEPESVQRVAQLDAAARDVGRRRVDAELDVGLDELARLGGARVARPEADMTGHDRRRGARAGRKQPALRQQGVEADPGHARNATGCAAAHRSPGPAGPPWVRDQKHLPPHPRRPRARARPRPPGGAVRARLEPAGLVAAFSLGVLLVGLALAGPDSLPLSTHQAFDLALVAALGGGGVGLGLAGDPAAGLLLATSARCSSCCSR